MVYWEEQKESVVVYWEEQKESVEIFMVSLKMLEVESEMFWDLMVKVMVKVKVKVKALQMDKEHPDYPMVMFKRTMDMPEETMVDMDILL